MNRRSQRRKYVLRDSDYAGQTSSSGICQDNYRQEQQTDRQKSPDNNEAAAVSGSSLEYSAEIVDMLQQINRQLEKMQQSGNAQQSAPKQEQPAGGSASQSAEQPAPGQTGQKGTNPDTGGNTITQDLQTILNQLLQNKAAGVQPEKGPESGAGAGTGQEQQESQPSAPKEAKTAAQVLAQAQYELANELEASLKKLKQVISESEKIANKIGSLIGEENNPNKS